MTRRIKKVNNKARQRSNYLDYNYIKNRYRLIPVDLSKQKDPFYLLLFIDLGYGSLTKISIKYGRWPGAYLEHLRRSLFCKNSQQLKPVN